MLDLAKTVNTSVRKQGMLGWQYNTIGVLLPLMELTIVANAYFAGI